MARPMAIRVLSASIEWHDFPFLGFEGSHLPVTALVIRALGAEDPLVTVCSLHTDRFDPSLPEFTEYLAHGLKQLSITL